MRVSRFVACMSRGQDCPNEYVRAIMRVWSLMLGRAVVQSVENTNSRHRQHWKSVNTCEKIKESDAHLERNSSVGRCCTSFRYANPVDLLISHELGGQRTFTVEASEK